MTAAPAPDGGSPTTRPTASHYPSPRARSERTFRPHPRPPVDSTGGQGGAPRRSGQRNYRAIHTVGTHARLGAYLLADVETGGTRERRPSPRIAPVNVGYDPAKPSSTISSNRVCAHRTGSSASRSRQYCTNGSISDGAGRLVGQVVAARSDRPGRSCGRSRYAGRSPKSSSPLS